MSLLEQYTTILMITRVRYDADYMGMISSTLCLIHCLMTPVLFAVVSCTAGSNSCCASGPVWWKGIDVLFLVVSLVAVYYTGKTTRNEWVKWSLYAGWVLLGLVILNEYWTIFSIPQQSIYVPSLMLVGVHLYNRLYCRCEAECCEKGQQ